MATGAQTDQSKSEQVRDTEITLGTGKLLGIFFGLVLICSVFFTMGYLLGRSTSAGGRTEIVGTVPSGGNSAGKPSAANKTSDANAQNCPPGSANCAPAVNAADSAKNPGAQPAGGAQQQAGGSTTPSAGKTQDQTNSTSPPADVKTGAGGSYMVQVAAVSKQEDAEILVSALRKKQYPVFIASVSGDPLFHVQVGPFSDPKDAEAMRSRLSGDGYNAIVKK